MRRGAAGAAAAVLVLALGAGEGRPSGPSPVTITLIASSTNQPTFEVLIPNFERIDPNITVEATYAPSTTVDELETTELAAGSGPDLLTTFPGCGTPVSVCELAKDGDLAPLVSEPWAKRSLRTVTSLSKSGGALYVFEPEVAPFGIFTNDALFRKLGLQVPQTFAQLLKVCTAAKSAGVPAVMLDGATGTDMSMLVRALAIPTVYARDPHWEAELKAGTVTFDGTQGWHTALQELAEMGSDGCLQPGAAGTSQASVQAEFAQGDGLILAGGSSRKGSIDAGDPQFGYSFHPFPGASSSDETVTFVRLGNALSVNAHSSLQNQAAARAFIDFVARPKQDALFAEITGGLTQYQFLKGQLPPFFAGFTTIFANNDYIVDPGQSWWNANVDGALQQDAVGLITGQETVDDVLNAMDAAWKQGPS